MIKIFNLDHLRVPFPPLGILFFFFLPLLLLLDSYILNKLSTLGLLSPPDSTSSLL
jgi:hypothetical protein